MLFQSQNGLILVFWVIMSPLHHLIISIPKWSDFSINAPALLQGLLYISIPKWSDFSARPPRTTHPIPLLISIPKWSDFSFFHDFFKFLKRFISIPKWSDFSSKYHDELSWMIQKHFNPKMV